jgi:hypothetical protein
MAVQMPAAFENAHSTSYLFTVGSRIESLKTPRRGVCTVVASEGDHRGSPLRVFPTGSRGWTQRRAAVYPTMERIGSGW